MNKAKVIWMWHLVSAWTDQNFSEHARSDMRHKVWKRKKSLTSLIYLNSMIERRQDGKSEHKFKWYNCGFVVVTWNAKQPLRTYKKVKLEFFNWWFPVPIHAGLLFGYRPPMPRAQWGSPCLWPTTLHIVTQLFQWNLKWCATHGIVLENISFINSCG